MKRSDNLPHSFSHTGQTEREFDGYNIGFPYTDTDNQVKGYEVRGYGGYKSKAAGTDSSSAAWVADFSGGNPEAVRCVFFVSPPSMRWLSTR